MATRKSVTLRTIAEEASLSVATVSMALADSSQIGNATKAEVLRICRKHGYKTPRQKERVKRQATTRLGFVSVGKPLHDESLSAILHHLAGQTSAQRQRLELATLPATASDAAIIADLELRIEALEQLLIYGNISTAVHQWLATCGTPVVLLGGSAGSHHENPDALTAVRSDEIAMGRFATTQLISKGHRKIGFICELMPAGMYNEGWRDGYRLAHLDAALPIEPTHCYVGNERFSQGSEFVAHFASLPECPTAYVCPSARVARALIDSSLAHGLNITPETVVIGDDVHLAERYHLTSSTRVYEDHSQMVTAALTWLKNNDGPATRCHLTIPFAYENLLNPK